jgi:phage replication-related protein YjqB (UPF0714/DUF867 family)
MDCYRDFRELAQKEIYGIDYSIEIFRRPSRVVIVAPHGGVIEPGTSEITVRIASHDLGVYLFEGRKKSGNGRLHLTSTHFDEPGCLSLIRNYSAVLAIHGCRNRQQAEAGVYIGGLHEDFRQLLKRHLGNSGFHVLDDDHTRGFSPANICNKGNLGKGAQIEISENLRNRMFHGISDCGRMTQPMLDGFIHAIRSAIHLLRGRALREH